MTPVETSALVETCSCQLKFILHPSQTISLEQLHSTMSAEAGTLFPLSKKTRTKHLKLKFSNKKLAIL
jgi:hypothetical protein